MNDFESYFTNPSYAEAYGFDGKGLIYIENERDCSFWEEIIESVIPNKYEVKRSVIDNDTSRGKRGLEKLYSSANQKVLIAIDSDFDYPCPNRSEHSKHINDKYILHTYSHSRESVICNIESINDTIKRTRLYERSSFDIANPLKKYSSICHKGLPAFLFLLDKRIEMASEEEFHSDLIISETKENKLILDSGDFNYEIFKDVNEKVEIRNNKHEDFIKNKGLMDQYEKFKESLTDIGLTEDTAYRYISGHVLYENFIIPLMKKIRSNLIKVEIENAKAEFNGKAKGKGIEDVVNGIHNHFKDNCSVTSLLNNNEKTKNDCIYLKIVDKVRQITTAA